MNSLDHYLQWAEHVPGWTRGAEARALAERAYGLPDDAVIVEIGSFFGAGAVLLAGARKLSGSGRVHCVDPFDGSGDAFSVPHYQAIVAAHGERRLRDLFDQTIAAAGLADWVVAHQGTATAIAATWATPIDLLFLDGDQSPAGARAAYDAWSGWLKPGGIIAAHNSDPRPYPPDHDGHFLLARDQIRPPLYSEVTLVDTTTFARRI